MRPPPYTKLEDKVEFVACFNKGELCWSGMVSKNRRDWWRHIGLLRSVEFTGWKTCRALSALTSSAAVWLLGWEALIGWHSEVFLLEWVHSYWRIFTSKSQHWLVGSQKHVCFSQLSLKDWTDLNSVLVTPCFHYYRTIGVFLIPTSSISLTSSNLSLGVWSARGKGQESPFTTCSVLLSSRGYSPDSYVMQRRTMQPFCPSSYSLERGPSYTLDSDSVWRVPREPQRGHSLCMGEGGGPQRRKALNGPWPWPDPDH